MYEWLLHKFDLMKKNSYSFMFVVVVKFIFVATGLNKRIHNSFSCFTLQDTSVYQSWWSLVISAMSIQGHFGHVAVTQQSARINGYIWWRDIV